MESVNGVGVKKGAWTKEEDILLRNCINKFGVGSWHLVPLRAGLNRCRKSCRLRWLNYLRPDVKRGYFSPDEVDLLHRLHKLLGNKWSLIAGRLPGRTANDIKNFWNTHISKKPSSAGDKRRRQTMTSSNVIRPKPRTLSKSWPPAWLSQVARSKAPRNDEEDEAPTKNQVSVPSSSSFLTLEEASDRNENIPIMLEDDLDECIRWWGNLLETTEDGWKETPFSVSGEITAKLFVEDQSWVESDL